jgi:3',5'-cyclic AMP phosphodiesterase CpdA
MFVAWVYGIAFFFWLLAKFEIVPEIKPQNPTKSALLLLMLATIGSLGLILAVPGWMAGIPPEGGVLYYLIQIFLALICIAITGPLLYGAIAERRRGLAAVTIAIHFVLCATIFLFPFAETRREVFAVYKSLRKVAPIPADCVVAGRNLFVDLSDLHLVSSPREKTNDGSVPGNAFFSSRLKLAEKFMPKYLFLTGDITDTGSVDQWEIAWESLKDLPDSTKVLMVPGNHDQNEAFISTPISLDEARHLTSVSVFDSKIARFFRVQARLFPEIRSASGELLSRVVMNAPPIVDPDKWVKAEKFFDEKVGVCMQNEPSEHLSLLRVKCQRGVRQLFPDQIRALTTVEQSDDYWSEIKRTSFPLYLIDTDSKTAVFLIGSGLSDSDSIGANAIGMFEDRQIQNLRIEIRSAPPDTRHFLFLLHHPITRPSDEAPSLPYLKDLTLDTFMDSNWWAYGFLHTNVSSANMALDAINEELQRFPAADGYVIFGHRHKRSLGVLGRLTFVEAPNVAAPSPNRGVYVGSVAANGLVIHWCEAE